ncbi:cysteine desulfurase family protein [Cytophagaceae bacterium ABcell3]|nr:cysteine desulfurase family protein [Cytophagaceae bacterium ABcell3]
MKVYLDNAATTPLAPEVFEEMKPWMTDHFGNPSSIHAYGRQTKAAVEKARRTIASLLNASPSEILFTSGGTEADNTAIRCSIKGMGIKHAITSPIEHHAVLHTLEDLEKAGEVQLHFVELDPKGNLEMDSLEKLLEKYPGSFVSLMHANNEVGNVNDIYTIGNLCKSYDAVFHTDTVQTIGHFKHDLSELNANFIVGSAHKFHGPKGVGFLYTKSETKIAPFITGGAQERNQRGGTENVYGIIGMAKAMEIAYKDLEIHESHIRNLKNKMVSQLKEKVKDLEFNGDCLNENSLYTVLNLSLRESPDNEMLLFNLDINNIFASGGSACSSGTSIGSHVLNHLQVNPARGHIRFSFSKYNTEEEIDYVVSKLSELANQ